ncbi:MAG: helix-turn-helix domain-containing protein [Lachnospiraceae bacterium]
MQFRDKLFQLRKKSGMTQAELAEALNVSRQAISKWEMGTTAPDINNILSISKIFRVSIDYLLNDELDIEEDLPLIKATSNVTKINLDNDELNTEEDSPTIKATSNITEVNSPPDKLEIEEESSLTKATSKTTKKYIWIRFITAFCIITSFYIIGIITHIPATVTTFLFTLGCIFAIYYIIKLLVLFLSNKKET